LLVKNEQERRVSEMKEGETSLNRQTG